MLYITQTAHLLPLQPFFITTFDRWKSLRVRGLTVLAYSISNLRKMYVRTSQVKETRAGDGAVLLYSAVRNGKLSYPYHYGK